MSCFELIELLVLTQWESHKLSWKRIGRFATNERRRHRWKRNVQINDRLSILAASYQWTDSNNLLSISRIAKFVFIVPEQFIFCSHAWRCISHLRCLRFKRRTFHVTLFLARCIRPFVDALDQVRIFITFLSYDYYFLLMILAEKTYRFIDAT